MRIEIKRRWNLSVLFAAEIPDDTPEFMRVRLAVELAVSQRADLRAADLRDANLRAADLSAANLSAADLRAADLSDANLSAANLRAADLRAANLRDANLSDADLSAADLRAADLSDANLSDADLSDADLSAANLSDADLSDADLSDADLTPVRDDLWAVLSAAPREVDGLRAALAEGRIKGTAYEGRCACLVGTIAHVREVAYTELGILQPNSSRPAERFFLSIHEGDTPDTNQHAKIALEWIDQWLANVRGAFAPTSTLA